MSDSCLVIHHEVFPAERIKKRFPKIKICVTMDGLYACGPVIKTCREYGWDYMLVFKEGSMKENIIMNTVFLQLECSIQSMIVIHTPGMISSSQEAMAMSKVTISLSEKLLQTLDNFAANWNTSRSGAVAELISRTEKTSLEAEMALGYQELADLNKNEARSNFQVQAEVILNDKTR
ncbi:MAG: hypothetical protein PHP26_08835 [Syntrophomonas sp.]|uniref:hypothetical protein n=1 Tax=Syntrophomonas sp. TaxID=2053627 RepID=UPI0026328F23|nr:hypothetical protein [Syntrophomonas sp.]MDD2510722.1 hypothetical protein [Syntrophomonas sp.]MDD3880078.1 hypothetical protein [Syntrophomonas sp.]MDD4627509.1 hypothetical protein [Syntrophomonas sp.]